MFCIKCGSKNEEGAVFCGQCGTKVSPAAEPIPTTTSTSNEDNATESTITSNSTPILNHTTCRQCNASIPKDNSFCPECGDARTPLKSDFNRMKDVAGGVIACAICLVIYGFTGWRVLYWLGALGFIAGMGSYAWHLIKFFRFYLREKNTSMAPKLSRVLLNGFGVVVLIVLAIISIAVFRAANSHLSPEVQTIRNSHLTQFSTTRTIGDAFDRFFDDANWQRIRDGGDTFIEVSGMGTYNGERIHVRVSFELLEEMFIVDAIRINGAWQNTFQKNAFLDEVFRSPWDGFRFD